jgi:hypothetical protein
MGERSRIEPFMEPALFLAPAGFHDFSATWQQVGGSMRVVEVDELIRNAYDAHTLSATEYCTDAVQEVTEAALTDKVYVALATDGDELRGKMHGVRPLRDSVSHNSAHGLFFVTGNGFNGGMQLAVKPYDHDTKGVVCEWVNVGWRNITDLAVFARSVHW